MKLFANLLLKCLRKHSQIFCCQYSGIIKFGSKFLVLKVLLLNLWKYLSQISGIVTVSCSHFYERIHKTSAPNSLETFTCFCSYCTNHLHTVLLQPFTNFCSPCSLFTKFCTKYLELLKIFSSHFFNSMQCTAYCLYCSACCAACNGLHVVCTVIHAAPPVMYCKLFVLQCMLRCL
jgi:hypothetical protein